MARIRFIKPEFFDDPELAELSPYARLFFVGLWLQADREGRLEDCPKRLKARIFPYDDVDVEALTEELRGKDMIRRFSSQQGKCYIWITNFLKHQRPHLKEAPSVIPTWESCQDASTDPAGEKPGKVGASPGISGTRTPDSGVLILDSGVLCLESGARRREAPLVPAQTQPRNQSVELGDKVRQFIEGYAELYREHRNGAYYHGRPSVDYQQACDLCRTWPDTDRLLRLAGVFLASDDEWIAKSNRSIPVFASRASWCDDRLREWEKAQVQA